MRGKLTESVRLLKEFKV